MKIILIKLKKRCEVYSAYDKREFAAIATPLDLLRMVESRLMASIRAGMSRLRYRRAKCRWRASCH
jgi:hypothetical protein